MDSPAWTPERSGRTGYCMGARLAVLAANLDPRSSRRGFHAGGLATEGTTARTRAGPGAPLVLFGHADNDRSSGPEAIATLGRPCVTPA